MIEAVCIASGPSLNRGDCDAVRDWRDAKPGRAVIVCNRSFIAAPWANMLYGMDDEFWQVYIDAVRTRFEGALYSRHGKFGTRAVEDHGENTGAGALLLAGQLGAQKIIMLGYDCSLEDGKHWHRDHPPPLHNCDSAPRWPRHFATAKAKLDGRVIINASRKTALNIFPRRTLEEALV